MSDFSTLPAFVGSIGIELWVDDAGERRGRAEMRPALCVPGTSRPRLGVLTTMVDIIVGSPPGGALTPTVDIRLRLLSAIPSSGPVLLTCRTVKDGRRLHVAEVTLQAGEDPTPFGLATSTYLNQRMAGVPDWGARKQVEAPPIDEILAPRYLDDRTVEIDVTHAVRNGPGGTIQGGAQAVLAEMASEHVLAPRGRFAVTDLDIRYVNAVKAGPVAASADVLALRGGEASVRVRLHDRGNADRIVAYVSTVCRRTDG